jgi:hypothetical protein
MHSILFVFISKPANHPELQFWFDFCKRINEVASNNPEIERFAENVLLIPAKSGVPAFGEILHAAKTQSIGYKVLFFEKEPEWIQSA